MTVFNFPAQRFVGFREINGFIVFANPIKRPTGVRKLRKTRRMGVTTLHLWRLSLSVLYDLVKTMVVRDRSKRAGSGAGERVGRRFN